MLYKMTKSKSKSPLDNDANIHLALARLFSYTGEQERSIIHYHRALYQDGEMKHLMGDANDLSHREGEEPLNYKNLAILLETLKKRLITVDIENGITDNSHITELWKLVFELARSLNRNHQWQEDAPHTSPYLKIFLIPVWQIQDMSR